MSKNSANIKNKIATAIKIIIGLIIISPLLIGLVFSFLPTRVLNGGVPSIDKILNNLTIENYKWVLGYIPIARFLLNTLIVCTIVVVAQVFLSSFAAYAFAFFKFRGRELIFRLILVAMMIPAEVTVVSNYIQVQSWGLINTYAGLTVTFLIGGVSIIMVRQFYMQIPKEIKEASLIDGCGDMRFLFSIAMPISIPIIASLAIYLFINVYNAYFWPMLIAQKTNMQTIQIGMSMLIGTENQEYGSILAGAVLCIIAPVIIFILGQDYIIKGMTAGAVKG